jgi:hypothetical protein
MTNGIKVKTVVAKTLGDILQYPDHYVCFPQLFEKDSALASTVDGRKIIKAGTVFPSNDENAKGLVFQDVDVTDGDQNAAVLVHGFVNSAKLPEAVSNEAKKAMPAIVFFPVDAVVYAVDTPEADPDGGNFETSVDVELSCGTEGADIYYTTNGSTPTAASTKYTGTAITLSATTTVKAIAIKAGISSDVMSKTFTKTN